MRGGGKPPARLLRKRNTPLPPERGHPATPLAVPNLSAAFQNKTASLGFVRVNEGVYKKKALCSCLPGLLIKLRRDDYLLSFASTTCALLYLPQLRHA